MTGTSFVATMPASSLRRRIFGLAEGKSNGSAFGADSEAGWLDSRDPFGADNDAAVRN